MIVSYNQLAGWNSHAEGFQFSVENEQDTKINDYYECLIECDNTAQCKKICREILM